MSTFQTIIKTYSEAFNSKDLDKILSLFSPSIEMHWKSQNLNFDIPKFIEEYQSHWAEPSFKPVILERSEEIGELDGQGIRVTWLDPGRQKRVIVDYHFAKNDGPEEDWKMIKHNVVDVTTIAET
ncbi:hypothetical protein CC1G_06915 [Coprinopsis cinerea okayama7|uniref:SnoaL-like domain-containing protein n=1 Tax=Coprinopsis cinerea (strain Okayama-7 / 130 / ATCC MYA-4618 / FGSC 9003) TaxID=240176 RepID=A8NZN3_COPC7|nr:hypothetical protein CC1G_06915 [Coprinopsis cinerea okayama7\|eukprot:XP_001837709.1 hypothetical protein CC1G_06915 [Coprinopsis cinerea okayama7\